MQPDLYDDDHRIVNILQTNNKANKKANLRFYEYSIKQEQTF